MYERSENKKISCGMHHSMILMDNGELWGFGHNLFNQLCSNDRQEYWKPILCMKDDLINTINCGYHNSIIFRKNGELLIFGHNPILLVKDPTIKFIMNDKVNIIWDPYNHHHINYPKCFQDSVLYLLLYLKRNFILTGLKIPKFVIYEIIKFAV